MKLFNDLFASFDQQDSLVFLLFLLVAFLMGYLLSWLVYSRQTGTWRKKAREADAEFNALQAEHQSFKEQYALREADLQHAQVEAEESRRQAVQVKQENAHLKGELEEIQAELMRLEATVTSQQVTIEDLNDQILGLRTKNRQLSQEEPEKNFEEEPVAPLSPPGDLQQTLASAMKHLEAIEMRLEKIESENEQLRRQLSDAPASGALQSSVEQLFEVSEEEEAEAAELQTAQARAAIHTALGTLLPLASEDEKDDLKRIKGIGPFLENQLNELGLFTFEQISQLDEVLIEQLTTAIRFFPGRILKDDWVGQAAAFFQNPPEPAEETMEDTLEESSATTILPDNFQEIEGIGPKIEVLLQDAGIQTYRQLADASVEHLKDILQEAGERFRLHDPSTWPEQARLAAEEKWDELQAYKEFLNGGE